MLENWQLDPTVILGLIAAGFLYVRADRRIHRARLGSGVPRSRKRCFLAGLVTLFAAVQSPIDGAAATSFAVHMVQHLMITMVAAPLLLLGAPVTLALQASKRPTRRRILSFLRSDPVRAFCHPVIAWAVFFGFMWFSHFSGLYEATLRSYWIHAAEHVAYLGTALLFWIPIVGVDPSPSRLSHPARILSLFLAMPAMAFLGLAIYSADHVMYAAYAAAEGAARALADQRAAGAIMWTGGMFLIVPALGFVLLDWMRADEREARRADARLLRSRAVTGSGA